MGDSTPFSSNQGNISTSGSVGSYNIIGHGNIQINVGSMEETHLLVQQLLDQWTSTRTVLAQAGFKADIAPSALPSANLSQMNGPIPAPLGSPSQPLPSDPSASLRGANLPPIPLRADDAKQLAKNFEQMDQLLRQVDQGLGQQVQGIQEIQAGQERFKVVDLLLQQGNLALWRFRHAGSRLFGQQMTANILARTEWPAPPELQALNIQARASIEVVRGIGLFNMFIEQRPELAMPAAEQLSHGQWRQVLDGWVAQQLLHEDIAQIVQTQLEAIGEPYRPEEVRTAQQEAEVRFSEALSRQPKNTTALVNLAIIKAESASFYYIESGMIDSEHLQRARDLFKQASDLLSQSSDRESKVAYGKCLLYSATSLPPNAMLESIQWAAMYSQHMQTSFSHQAQRTIRWDVYQRNLARNDPSFYHLASIQQARDAFSATGETMLAEQCARTLQSIEQMNRMIPIMTQRLQMNAPVVGTWSYRGQNMFSEFSGMIVFDADSMFRWQADIPGVMMSGPQRIISIGQYQMTGNMIQMQGQRWNIPLQYFGVSMPVMPFPMLDQIMLQANMQQQLVLLTQQEGLLLQCQRL